jgi:hypothetical protein
MSSGRHAFGGAHSKESAMHALTRYLAAGLCAFTAVFAVHAQSRLGGIGRGTTTTPPPSASARAATAAPNPAGLRPIFPAGISSGSGASVSSDPIAANASPVGPTSGSDTGTTGNFGSVITPELDNPGNVGNFGAATTVVGGGGGGIIVAGPAQRSAGGAGGFTAIDQARSFMLADANHDGELTRAEARRLSIVTMSFEEMDRNFDQVISRFEYDDSLR